MNTNKHPLAGISFLNRALPVRKATRGCNFAPHGGNVESISMDKTTWLKERGANEFVKIS